MKPHIAACFQASGAPFSSILPYVSCVAAHGGVGTLSEAFLAGIPCIVTGQLVADQIFWGHRVQELGLGAGPIHVSTFHKKVVQIIDQMLATGSSEVAKSQELAMKLSKSAYSFIFSR